MTKVLTDTSLRARLKSPPSKQHDVPDGTVPGLSARITSKGSATWNLRLRVAGEGGQSKRGHRPGGRQYRLNLGQYPTVSIKQARAKAIELSLEAEAGKNPVRKLERDAVGREETIEALVEAFLTTYAMPKLRSWKNARSSFQVHMLPAWKDKLVDSIEQREAQSLLVKVAMGLSHQQAQHTIERPGAARELRKWGSLLFSWGMRSGLAERNPFLGTKNPVPQMPRQRFLEMWEARAVWQGSTALQYPWKQIIQLLLLTACRLREVAHCRQPWVDIGEARMLLPHHIHKSKRPFLVALTEPAIDVLKSVHQERPGDYLFSTTGGSKPVYSVSRKIVKKLHQAAETEAGRKIEHFTPHDFRRTVRTHLSRLCVPEVHAEMVIGHTLRGIVGTYNVYDFEAEKRAALARWAQELIRD